jgi:Cu/Ag efflux pump CusA
MIVVFPGKGMRTVALSIKLQPHTRYANARQNSLATLRHKIRECDQTLLDIYQKIRSRVNYIFSGTSIPIVSKAAVSDLRAVSATDIRIERFTGSASEMIL